MIRSLTFEHSFTAPIFAASPTNVTAIGGNAGLENISPIKREESPPMAFHNFMNAREVPKPVSPSVDDEISGFSPISSPR